MKHESIVVVYDSSLHWQSDQRSSGLAIAEEIADKLGAETVSVQSINNRQIENSQSFILAVEFQSAGQLTPHWLYAYLNFHAVNLKGKKIAVFVALGNKYDDDYVAKEFCDKLKENGAHIVGELQYAGTAEWNLDNWVCAISPNL